MWFSLLASPPSSTTLQEKGNIKPIYHCTDKCAQNLHSQQLTMADWVGLDSDVPTLRPQIKPYPNLSRFQIEANLHGARWAALGVLWYRLGATATATAKQEYARDLL